jgi:hypothetical protein
VRTWVTSLALVLLLLASPGRADVFDEPDGREPKKADAKDRGDGADAARHEQELWEAHVKKLGDGPVYRVEVLYRGGPGADHLTYCRHYVSAAIPTPHGLFGFGVNAKGEAVPPADPGRQAVTPALEARKVGENDKPLPPLATRTRHFGITLEYKDSRPGEAAICNGDLCNFIALPTRPGEPKLRFSGRALFRLELVTAEGVLNAGPLRQDVRGFRERIDVLRRDVLATNRLTFLAGDRDELVKAAYLFREAEVLAAVRKMLDDWLAQPVALGEDLTTGYVTDCLAELGDERDFAAFHRLKKDRPMHAWDLGRSTLKLVERVGAAKAMPLIGDLLNNPTSLNADGRINVLRELDPRIPPFTEGDLFLTETVRHFRLKATCYEMRPARQTLDALQKKKPLTPEQEQKLESCHLSEHVFLSEGARRQGVELVLDWFKQYQPPANK